MCVAATWMGYPFFELYMHDPLILREEGVKDLQMAIQLCV